MVNGLSLVAQQKLASQLWNRVFKESIYKGLNLGSNYGGSMLAYLHRRILLARISYVFRLVRRLVPLRYWATSVRAR
jgi:hypothetical protein